MKKIRKAVLLPDIHYPLNINLDRAVIPFIKDFRPDFLIYMGDQLEMDMISSWNENKPGKNEMKRLRKDYINFKLGILFKIEKLLPKACKKIWFSGNHEQRATWFVEKFPAFKGMVEPDKVLNLEKRGYEIIPFGGIYKLGKLYVLHGKYWNKYHTNKTVYEFENSCVYAHTHNPQVYAKTVPLDTKRYHIATCLGCLCNTTPEYKAGKATRWINQFGVVYLEPRGHFHLYPVTIVGGNFVFEGKLYGRSK